MHFPDDYTNLTVSILIPTFNRPVIVVDTINKLKEFLRFVGKIHYFVGVDGQQFAPDHFGMVDDVTIVPGPCRGYGANMNNLIRAAKSDILLHIDDDMHLRTIINLDRHVVRLMTDETAGLIRIMGVGSHRIQARLEVDYWVVDWESIDLYVYSNRPYISHRRFWDCYGPHPENIPIGATEEGYCHQCKAVWRARNRTGPNVLVPLYNLASDEYWTHNDGGISWNQKEIGG